MIYTGPGIGIAATGLLGGAVGRWGSEAGWVGFGLLSLVLIAVIWRIFGDGEPAHAGAPAGRAAPPSAGRIGRRAQRRALAGRPLRIGRLRLHHHRDLPAGDRPPGAAGFAMAGLLLAAVRAGHRAGCADRARAPIHWDNRLLLAAAYALQAVGVVLSVAWPTIWGFGLGSLLLGMPFTAITLFAMRDARRLRGNASAGLIGYATASYGVGQILGPLFAAPLAQRTGSFAVALCGRRGRAGGGALLFAMVWRRSASGQSGPNAVETPVSVTHLAYNSRLTTKRAGTNRPFFIGRSIFDAAGDPRRVGNPAASCELKGEQRHVALQQTVEQTVAGLGYDLVEIERSAGGLAARHD